METNLKSQADGEGPESGEEMDLRLVPEVETADCAFCSGRGKVMTADTYPCSREDAKDCDACLGTGKATEIPATYTCWDCGSEFKTSTPNQRECTRCYVAGKL